VRPDKKRARSKSKLAELFGLEAPETPTGPTAQRIKDDNSREAEAVLNYIEKPKTYLNVTCRHCDKPFMVNRSNVALCSDYCRAKELAAVGITWRWDRSPEERWYYVYDGDKRNTEPLVIGPEATEMILNNDLLGEVLDSSVETSVSVSVDTDDDSFLYGFDVEDTA